MKLHEQAKHYKAKSEALESELENILSYVRSDKFDSDNMVNVNDIYLRINEAKRNIQIEFSDKE